MAKRGRPNKSSFYHTRWNKVGLNEQRAAELLGVDIDTVKQWDKDGAPVMAERLLLLWDSKRIQIEGWEGFLFSRGILRWKNRRWTAASLMAMEDQREHIHELECEIRRLRTWRGLSTIFVDKVVESLAHHKRRRGL